MGKIDIRPKYYEINLDTLDGKWQYLLDYNSYVMMGCPRSFDLMVDDYYTLKGQPGFKWHMRNIQRDLMLKETDPKIKQKMFDKWYTNYPSKYGTRTII